MIATGAAGEQAELLLLAIVPTDGRSADPPLAVVGAPLVLATEAGQILRHGGASQIPTANGAVQVGNAINTKDLSVQQP